MASLDASSQTTQQQSSSSAQIQVQNFSNPVAMKLDEEHYLPWKQQAKATIEGHDLVKFITGEEIPQKFATAEDQDNGLVSVAYQQWKKQDSLLKSWLLSSMSTSFTTRMVGCEFSHQIWKRLEVFFASQIQAKIRQLKNKLSNTKKEGSISIYLLEIKKIVDSLISVGAPLSENDHVEAILEGLTEEYSPLITSITSREKPISVGQLEALLMAQEERIEKYRKQEGAVQANMAQSHSQKNHNQDSFRAADNI